MKTFKNELKQATFELFHKWYYWASLVATMIITALWGDKINKFIIEILKYLQGEM